jgi:hypothetical protein
MSIQGSINQLLSMAAIGIRISPGYETLQKRAALRRAEAAGRKRIETIAGEIDPEMSLEESAKLSEMAAKAGEQQAEVLTQQFELDPSKETLVKATAGRQAAKNLKKISERAQEELNARQTEVRGNQQPTITQMLGKDPEVASSVGAWERTIRRDLNGNNQ